MTLDQPTGAAPARNRRPLWIRSAIVMAAIAVLLIAIEAIDVATGHHMDRTGGIEPRDLDGLDGILWAPLLHADWQHLFANLLPALVLGYLLLLARRFVVVTAIVWVVSGVGVWLFSPPYTFTVGASGVIFGWLTYLLIRGIFTRNPWQLLLGVVLFVVYGSVLWGVLPSDNGVSWQGHLFGALGGLVAAWLLGRRDRDAARRRRQAPGATSGVPS